MSPDAPACWRIAFRVVIGLSLAGFAGCGRAPRAQGPFPQEAYVWQRIWDSNVVAAVDVANRAAGFHRLVVLGAEIAWQDGVPRVVRVPFSAAPFLPPSHPAGLALRVGPFAGPFRPTDETARLVRATARDLLHGARRQGFEPSELQLDFDCATARLEGYRVWLEALRGDVAPVPLVFTALPAWLEARSFAPLARAADGFVLQVHSLARPRDGEATFQLCDPQSARRAVELAGRAGVPFRVALPTYGYLAAFDPEGRFLGASAEGYPAGRPPGTTWRELAADPVAMAGLVRNWQADRPATLRGLIWYRLPVPGDRLNWRLRTLETVMSGRIPAPELAIVSRSPEPLLTEIELRNQGTADHTGPVFVRVTWAGAHLVGHDGIRGFTSLGGVHPDEILFTNAICRLPAGDAVIIGWVRLDAAVPVTLEIPPSPPPPG